MFEKFGDYMFYLLNAPLRKKKAGKNQLQIFFSIVGEIFDSIMEDIFHFRRQRFISTADPLMLEIIGQDRDMFRLQGETVEAYRRRLQAKALLAELGGTETGLLLALDLLGYPDSSVEPLYKTDRNRWAEICIIVPVLKDINYDAILYEVLKVKPARTLPCFRFSYTVQATEQIFAVGGLGSSITVKAYIPRNLPVQITANRQAFGQMHTLIITKRKRG